MRGWISRSRSWMRSTLVAGTTSAALLATCPRPAEGGEPQVDGLIIGAPCHGKHRWDAGCPEPRTPEESAAYERHQRAVRGEASRTELLRKQREAFQARVAAEAARLGAGREADAERLVIMRATAEQAAGFKPAPLPEDDAAPPPRKKCITRETMGTAYGTGMSEQEARRSMQQPVGKRCKLTSSTCKSDRLTPWWVECTGSYVCPPTEFPCSPVVRA